MANPCVATANHREPRHVQETLNSTDLEDNRRVMSNPYEAPRPQRGHFADAPPFARPIQLRGSLRFADVIHTHALILRRRWLHACGFIVIYVAFVLALGMLSSATTIFGNTFLLLGLFVGPGILPFTMLAVAIRLRQDEKRQVGVFSPTESTISSDGIRRTLDTQDVALPWSEFASYVHSQRVILLFLRDSRNHLIVARSKLVDPSDWSELLEFLAHAFPQP